ncbi:hypothetical protein NC653_030964 [Populus alba x Populus x berolinensis]|uniref:BTB domain-containing protein n=1 Tax=Populus alba x Populus x berolinensis TaxID=444605 RepID=A0AAD6Q0Z4_9ROSI|nr:hypothetical protein NC653_030964 [Populus alba x Populus x berolinensis]
MTIEKFWSALSKEQLNGPSAFITSVIHGCLKSFPFFFCSKLPISLSIHRMQIMKDHTFSSLIRLNIGGKKFCTTIDTLTQGEPDSMLAAMFRGRFMVSEDPDKGYVFIDRDGKHFRHILNWLRDGVVPTLTDAGYSELMREAEYYQLLDLSYVDFSYASLQNVLFSRANLLCAKFR